MKDPSEDVLKSYTSPPQGKKGMPGGIPYIIGNEFAERFSFYGMKAILFVFMTEYLVNSAGALDTLDENIATFWVHIFVAAVYFFPLIGAYVSDAFWGKYRTIMVLSVVYSLGHIALALDETRFGLAIGLTLIAIGAGGIKPCVSAHVGDQFGEGNKHLLERVFAIFYISINAGAVISQYMTPELLEGVGPWIAFGIPGLLMITATILFYAGRNKFTAVPPVGRSKFWQQIKSSEGKYVLKNLAAIYLFIAVFWSLFDQTASSWVSQAKNDLMDKDIFGWEILPSQIQMSNPLFILILVPLFSAVIYPKLKLKPLTKITCGLFVAVIAFVITGIIQYNLDSGVVVSVWWQLLAYMVLTSAEVMVSITGLEFSYTQAPNSMKSIVMSFWLLSVALGNVFTALINLAREIDVVGAILAGGNYFMFFSLILFITAIGFFFIAKKYKPRTHIQGSEPLNPEEWEN